MKIRHKDFRETARAADLELRVDNPEAPTTSTVIIECF